MNRNELIEMIRDEVQRAAFEELKRTKSDEAKTKKPEVNEEDFLDDFLFYGGMEDLKHKGKEKPITIVQESREVPQVTSSEIKQFEDSFEEFLKDVPYASVVFQEQPNGYSMSIFDNNIDGVEAKASGSINMGQMGRIIWEYSIKNGLKIQTGGFEINQDNKYILEKLYNHYDTWQKEWREKVMNPGTGEDMGGDISAPAGGMEAPGGEMEAGLGQSETPGATTL
jgi:hypothetical protein